MPHVVLQGDVDLSQVFDGYQPEVLQEQGQIIKLLDAFINADKNTLLIEALVVEDGPPNRFFIQVGTRGDKATVRIYPGTDPEKTPGVKRSLAQVAGRICSLFPGVSCGSSNIGEFLP